jgi:hypothetical protein
VLQLLSIGALACGAYYGVLIATHYQQEEGSWYMRPEGKNDCVQYLCKATTLLLDTLYVDYNLCIKNVNKVKLAPLNIGIEWVVRLLRLHDVSASCFVSMTGNTD